jgi:hypothetical protein
MVAAPGCYGAAGWKNSIGCRRSRSGEDPAERSRSTSAAMPCMLCEYEYAARRDVTAGPDRRA